MNSSAAADLSGQEGPHGAIRAGLPSPLLDRLHSVCQRCSLNRPSSCRNPKVIYTIWLQNICFANRSVIKGLSALIRMWGRKITQKWREGFSSSLPHFSLAGDWHPSSLSCLLLSLVPRVRTGMVIMPWSSVLLSVGYTAQCKPLLHLHFAPQSGAHELRIAPVSLQLSSMHPAVVYLQHCKGQVAGSADEM